MSPYRTASPPPSTPPSWWESRRWIDRVDVVMFVSALCCETGAVAAMFRGEAPDAILCVVVAGTLFGYILARRGRPA